LGTCARARCQSRKPCRRGSAMRKSRLNKPRRAHEGRALLVPSTSPRLVRLFWGFVGSPTHLELEPRTTEESSLWVWAAAVVSLMKASDRSPSVLFQFGTRSATSAAVRAISTWSSEMFACRAARARFATSGCRRRASAPAGGARRSSIHLMRSVLRGTPLRIQAATAVATLS
jgi:hypothetical protein